MNSPFKTIIIDDEPIAIEVMKAHLSKLNTFKIAGTFTNALDALPLLHKETVDLLFLDIEMPGISGIDFAKSVPKHTSVIFTTAYRNYAVEAFDLEVIDYLLKPISMERFLRSINRFYTIKSPKEDTSQPVQLSNHTIEVRADKKTYRLNTDDILYIESIEDYIKIHTDKQRLLVHLRMHEIEKQLTNMIFLRVHRSFLVNKNHIISYSASEIEIGEQQIPIGRTYKEKVSEALKT